MKEVIAVIRMNMVNKTKEVLAREGLPSLNCRKVLGRGKKKVDFSLIEGMVSGMEFPSPMLAESLSEGHRLIPKRLISFVVLDEDVKRIVKIIIEVNSQEQAGDGKIFVMPVWDAVRVRTGERGEQAIN